MIPIAASLTVLGLAVGAYAAGHALLHKRDHRAALGWITICLLLPVLGPFLYLVMGVNRIRTRARKLTPSEGEAEALADPTATDASCAQELSRIPDELSALEHIGRVMSGRDLVAGNRVSLLHNGEAAYPAMLEAIESAERRVFLATYIFHSDGTGRQFVDALARAVRRGIEVRVLVDGVGELYSRPRARNLLHEAGVPVARFLPPRLLPPSIFLNLRNHRKILVVDGTSAFVGGMNVGDHHLASRSEDSSRVVDLHLGVEGPVAVEVERTFLEDWRFASGEELPSSAVDTADHPRALCRVIVDGPNEDLNRLQSVLAGAISAARHRISIMTPYFLPPRELIAALQGAALRGVEVSVILPANNNLPFMTWAACKMLWELAEFGVRIFFQGGPFVHSKLFVVDEDYAHIGSANLDARSLRLNFELALEIYSRPLVTELLAHFDARREQGEEVTLDQLESRSLPVRLRDALAWLFHPYL